MPLAALREILAAAAVEAPQLPQIRGADPVLPTPYRVGTAGAAALAALGVAVAQLWESRGGRPQSVAVGRGVIHAAAQGPLGRIGEFV